MKALTNEQQAVINSPEAMKIIATEAKEFLANKFNCTVSDVEKAYLVKNEKVMTMLAELITKGVNECAKLIK
jgi:hypothetical protein